MNRRKSGKMLVLTLLTAMIMATPTWASLVTGNPQLDGWALQGHSLENGIYVRGSANYGFDIYSSALTVAGGSMLEISDDAYSWLAGDTILGVGGVFTDINAVDAGWSSFTGNSVNSQLSQEYGPGLQIKFGTADATWSPSTVSPGSGNGSGSTADGGTGTVFLRTSRWFHADTPLGSQSTDTTWSGNSGMLMELDKDGHISRQGTVAPDARIARVIWQYDDDLGAGKPVSWQILLNTSLLDRTAPGDFTGLTPGIGDLAIFSVQDRNSAYTDAVIAVVPEPMTMTLLAFGGLALLRRRS